jgi:Peptidase M50B-like
MKAQGKGGDVTGKAAGKRHAERRREGGEGSPGSGIAGRAGRVDARGMDALSQAVAGPQSGGPAPLPGAVAALIGLVVVVVVIVPFLWPLADHFDTMVHEGAHAMVGGAFGYRLLGVLLDRDAGGLTAFGTDKPLSGLGWTLTGFAGYLGPSAAGLGAAKLIETGRVIAPLWVAIFLLVLLLFLVRKSFGLVSVPVAVALLALVVRNAHSGFEEFSSYAMTWLLLLSGLRTALAHGAASGDAYLLRAGTHVPRRVWALLWLAGTLLAVVVGGKWLVLRT